MPYDIFVSYARCDDTQGRITQFVERIKTDFGPFAKRELMPFFDQQEIQGMQDWRQRVLQGLRESHLLLACLSPAYLQSEYCEWEFVEYLKFEIGHLHGFNGVSPIYFVEVTGWDSKDFDQQCAAWVAELRKRQHFDLRLWHDKGEEALREAAVQERMGKLNRQIVQTITRGERAEQSLGNVDAHNPHFIGRTANLRLVRENFIKPGQIGVVTAVNGVGGLGKTALAIEYAHAFADEYGGGRWQVRCAGKDDLRLALAELATPIGFEFTEDEKKNANLQFECTRRELKKLADAGEPHRCLLILDNVDRPGMLHPAQVARLNAGDWLHVLATTRLGENELHGAHKDRSFLAIDELPPEDALALIESYQPGERFHNETERSAAHEIVRLLGCFTLAVESAAVYLGQFADDVTCAAFLRRLKKESLDGLDSAAGQSSEGILHGEKRLSATLQPTLERLGAAEKLALEFAALLPPEQVALPWLRALVGKTFPQMECDAEPGHPDPWKNVLRTLFSLRLFQATGAMDENGQPRVIRTHRLIQQSALRHSPTEEKNARKVTLDNFVMERVAVQRIFWIESWERSAISELAKLWDETNQPNASSLRSSFARAMLGQLGWSSKGKVNEPAGRAVELFNKAIIFQDWNQLQRSKELFVQSLKLFNEAGNDHATTIAQIYFDTLMLELGEIAELDTALQKLEKVPEFLNVDHLLSRMSERGNFVAEKSDWEAAIRIQHTIEEICRKVSYQEARLCDSLERQGVIFADKLGDSEKALIKFKEHEKLLSALLPEVEKSNKAVSAFDVAATLLQQNEFDRSCEMFLESIKLFDEVGDRMATDLARMCFGAVLAEIENTEPGKSAIQKVSHQLTDRDFYRDRLKHKGIVSFGKLREMFKQCPISRVRASLSLCLGNQGVVLERMNEHESALTAYREAERICRTHDLKEALVLPILRQAIILSNNMTDCRVALTLAEEAVELASRHASANLCREARGILDQIRAQIPNTNES
jgi:tetratricopeptide (TPR) repeat protein